MDGAAAEKTESLSEEYLQNLDLDSDLRERLQNFWENGKIKLDIPIIDLQHIWLVYLILELDKECRKAGAMDPDRVKKITAELLNFTAEHFTLEEDLCLKFGYPESVAHEEQHEHFVHFLEDRAADIKNGNLSAVKTLVNFLMDWLSMHIQKEDMRYRDYFVRKNLNLREYFQDVIAKRTISIDKAQAALYNSVVGSTEVGAIISDNIVNDVIKIWNTHKLSTFIPVVDLQHIWLISLIVELDNASRTMHNLRREKIFIKVVHNAIQYARDHFHTEELIMKQFNYINLSNHLKQHEGFLDFVNRRADEYKKGDPKAASRLVADLKEWLLSHIAIEDKAIYLHLKTRINDIQKYVRELINSNEIVIRKKHIDLYNKVCGLAKSD